MRKWLVCLFACLCFFFVALENFSLITGEGLQILTYARHSWPLSSEDGTPTVTRGIHSFKMVISEDPWPSHLLSSVWQLSIAVFFRLRSVAAGIWSSKRFACGTNKSTKPKGLRSGFHCATASVLLTYKNIKWTKYVFKCHLQHFPYIGYKFWTHQSECIGT